MIKIHFPVLKDEPIPFDLAASLHVRGAKGASAGEGPEKKKYDYMNAHAGEFFEAVDLEQAQVIVYPYKAETCEETARIAQEAAKRKIGCLFFSWGDADEAVNVPYGTVYRHSMFADRRLPWERAMPAMVSDPQTELGGALSLREKGERPRVGFCGFVSNPLMRGIYRLLRRERKAAGLNMRAKLLGSLRRTRGVECDFVTRQSYWAGTRSRFHNNVAGEFEPRRVFWNNVLENDYTVCIRARVIFRIDFMKCWRRGGFRFLSIPDAYCRLMTRSIGSGIACGLKKQRWDRRGRY